MTERPQSLAEEIANSASHGLAVLAVLAAVPFLFTGAGHLAPAIAVGFGVFVVTGTVCHFLAVLQYAA